MGVMDPETILARWHLTIGSQMSAKIVMSSKVTEAARGLTHRLPRRWLIDQDIPKRRLDEQPAGELLNLCDQNKSSARLSCQVSKPEPIFRHGAHGLRKRPTLPPPSPPERKTPCHHAKADFWVLLRKKKKKLPRNLEDCGIQGLS